MTRGTRVGITTDSYSSIGGSCPRCGKSFALLRMQIQKYKYKYKNTPVCKQYNYHFIIWLTVQCAVLSLRNIYFQTKICFKLRKSGVVHVLPLWTEKKSTNKQRKIDRSSQLGNFGPKCFKEDRTLVSLYAGQTGQHSSQLIWFVTIIKITIHHYKSVESHTI